MSFTGYGARPTDTELLLHFSDVCLNLSTLGLKLSHEYLPRSQTLLQLFDALHCGVAGLCCCFRAKQGSAADVDEIGDFRRSRDEVTAVGGASVVCLSSQTLRCVTCASRVACRETWCVRRLRHSPRLSGL